MSVAIFDDTLFDSHLPDSPLWERPSRTATIRSAIRDTFRDDDTVVWFVPRKAPVSELERIHSTRYRRHLLACCALATNNNTMESVCRDTEVLVSADTLKVLQAAIGAVQQAVQLVLSPDTPITYAFCNIRPPGHHASRYGGSGFCIVNNVWIGVHQAAGMRVAIVDWDLHHGDGTESFTDNHRDDNVLFVSIHQSDLWPNTSNPAHPNTRIMNCELEAGSGDREVMDTFQERVIPRIREFQPGIILVSCGFDAHKSDPLGDLQYSSDVYGWMTAQLVELGVPIVSLLEGGYELEALHSSAIAHISGFLK